MSKPYPVWLCTACPASIGRTMAPDHIATWHVDVCCICGEEVAVTEPRDYCNGNRFTEAELAEMRKKRCA